MKVYIKYQIKTLEPVKMAAPGTQQGQEMSRSYILGSSIRGALISAFLKDKDIELDESPILREEFLTNTKFLHAYITKTDKNMRERICIPTPDCYVADKQKVRSVGDAPLSVDNRLYNDSVKGEAVGRDTFCFLDGKNVYLTDVKMTANLHIQKANNREEGRMFRYEAVERGQVFTGFIQCEEKYAADFIKLLNRRYLCIGGSKGSGYGKCEILKKTELIHADAYRELIGVKPDEYQGMLFIYALSDLILYNEDGMVVNAISEKFLEDKLGIQDVKLKKAYVTTIQTSGYNHKHKAHSVQQTAVRAGSVYQYEYSGNMDKDAVRKLEEAGVGLRKTEGYGCILIQPDFHQDMRMEYKDEEQPVDDIKGMENKRTLESTEILGKIQDRIVERRMYDGIVYKYSYKKMIELKNHYRWKLTKTQANQLYKVLNRMYFLKDTQTMDFNRDELKRYLIKHKNIGLEATMISTKLSLYTLLDEMSKQDCKFGLTDIDSTMEYVKRSDIFEERQMNRVEYYDMCLYLKSLVYYFIREESQHE